MLGFPKNIWILVLASPLSTAVSSVMILAGSLLARSIAPEPQWATLPMAFLVVGMAAAVVPAILFMKRYGRRAGHLLGISAAFTGSMLAVTAALTQTFLLLLASSFCFGISQAFVQQYRFAAIESLEDQAKTPLVLSWLMISGIVAAFIGPEIAVAGKDWLPHAYAGSFLLLAGFNATAFLVMRNFKNPPVREEALAGERRPLSSIVGQPLFLLALAAAAVGNGVMSFVMTATPLSMHDIDGLDLVHTKHVIQSHIMAMFAPSFIMSFLIRRFNLAPVLFLGASIYVATLLIARTGHEVLHYWWALVLLGLGWNALFLGGTTLLSRCYAPHERFKVQAFNDFSVFFLQALASLSAGWVLFRGGWSAVIMIAAPFVGLIFILSALYLLRQLRGRPGREAAIHTES